MIFVTVGTHEQQFNRLVESVDDLKKKDIIKEDVIIQTGYSTYEPTCCKWKKFFPYKEMLDLVDNARIVITHGGPSSFIMPLQIGKIPIVVPRQHKYGEHVNDHQVSFSRDVAERKGIIIIVEDVKKLGYIIEKYDEITAQMENTIKSNNKKFNDDLESIVESMFND